MRSRHPLVRAARLLSLGVGWSALLAGVLVLNPVVAPQVAREEAAHGAQARKVARLPSPSPSFGLPSPTALPSSTPSPRPSPAGHAHPTPSSTPHPTASPRSGPMHPPSPTPHVMVIMEENKGYGSVIGSSSAPYVNALAGQYASASAWYGVWHPSLPNYLGIVSGSTQGVSSDCTGCGPFAGPSLGSQLTQAGIPWTAYMESMPSPCSIAGGSGNYAKKHNPFVYFSDVLANGCAAHDVPYPGAAAMVSALDGAGAPDFVWVTPNLTDDMHNGSVAQGDAWLQANLAPVLASPWFLDYESTVVVTMDEWSSDNTGVGTANPGGGHILTLVISHSSLGVGAYTSPGNHYGMLRTIEEAYGLPLLGGAGDPRNGDLTALFDR